MEGLIELLAIITVTPIQLWNVYNDIKSIGFTNAILSIFTCSKCSVFITAFILSGWGKAAIFGLIWMIIIKFIDEII
jgi:hypothetical protein